MATLRCSNDLVNDTIMDMAAGVTYLSDWQGLLLTMVSLNVFLIYFGQALSDPGFWHRRWRSLCKCKKKCRRRVSHKQNVAKKEEKTKFQGQKKELEPSLVGD